jgi:ATP-binding cassette subfamily B protein
MLIQLTINKGIQPDQTSFFITSAGGFIIEMTIIQILLLLMESFMRYVFTFTTAALGQNVVRDLRNDTYTKILHLNLRQFDQTPIGTLTTRTINDIESVNDIFSDGVIPIIADLLSILSILTYMLLTNWRITLICLIPFPFLILATYFFKEAVNRSFIRVRNAVAALNAFVQEHLSGMSVVQSFTAEEKELAGFRKINTEHRDANIKAIFAYSVFFPVVELVSALSIGLLVWWTARESLGISPEQASQTAGIITSFILCLNLLFRPLRVIADKFNVLQMGMIAGERVFKVLDSDEVLLSSDEERERFKGDIKFEKVWFSYQEGVPVLKDLSFHVKPGQTMAIVGNTGSGKTTMVNLLNRLYPLSSGRILIDDIAVDAMDISSLRKQIAVVLQDVFLFSGSIMENITLRNDAIDKGKVVEAAKMIGIHDFIMKLPGGYNFNVMERGGLLSLGQRQLISFVRALLYNPAVLILDEATSSVDTESEALIQQAVQKIVSGRTSIVIAHRLSTIKKADIIMVLDKGNLVEMGTHEGLLAKKAAYFELYQKQFILPH